MTTIHQVFLNLWRNPGELLVRRWNWKSALYSSLMRSSIFFAVNMTAGLRAAFWAMFAEFVYRVVSAGFYGALTQAFRRVEPKLKGFIVAMIVLITVSHTIEFAIHWLRGTPNLAASVLVSMGVTCVSTVFNLHAMRRGVLITGKESHGLLKDLQLLPSLFRGERVHP